jgi:hypothetical protein
LPVNYEDIISKLSNLPNNQISDEAERVYSSLINQSSPELLTLALNYIGHAGYLISAAEWLDKPYTSHTCDQDLDFDGSPECILSTPKLFMIVDLKGGYIPFLFVKNRDVHQIIGPSWEFMLGMSDPSSWNLSAGVLSDPGQIIGAFADNNTQMVDYDFYFEEEKLILYNDDMAMRKSFETISDTDLLVNISTSGSKTESIKIPLVLDPWMKFSRDWGNKYSLTKTDSGFKWEIINSISVELLSNMELNVYPFNSTKVEMVLPENPNFDYSPGHYLPFPIAVAEFQAQAENSIELLVAFDHE